MFDNGAGIEHKKVEALGQAGHLPQQPIEPPGEQPAQWERQQRAGAHQHG